MDIKNGQYADMRTYQIYAYQENVNSTISPALWKKVSINLDIDISIIFHLLY